MEQNSSTIPRKGTLPFARTRGMQDALLATFLWSTVASAFKLTLGFADVSTVLLTASATSLLVLYIVLLYQGKLWRLRLLWKPRDYAKSALLGALNPFFYYLLMFQSYDALPAQLAQPLNYIWPVFLILFSAVLLRQKVHGMSWVKIGVSFAGVVVISFGGGAEVLAELNFTGVACALGSAAIWALYWILNMQEDRDRIVRLFVNFAFGTLFILVYQLASGQFALPTGPGLVGSLYIGVFEMGITYVVWFRALTSGESSARIGNVVYLVPFLSLILIGTVVGETIHPSTFVGLLLIVSGITLDSLLRIGWVAESGAWLVRLARPGMQQVK
ncbi:MAG TPA: DMT family transporter [Bacteroidota bacterium]|nr:DMT family transporter [Bacteroidota bacterium]